MAVSTIVVWTAFIAAARAGGSDVQTFVQRAIDDGGRPGDVTAAVGQYPKNWTAPVPLPTALPLLGSISRRVEQEVTLLYRPSDVSSAYGQYVSQLRAAGFLPHRIPSPAFNRGGFSEARTIPAYSMFCRGLQGVNVSVPDASTDDLRVIVLSSEASPLSGCTEQDDQPAEVPHFKSPVPDLVAPSGVSVSGDAGSAGFGFGYGPSGVQARMSTSALLRGPVDAATLIRVYEAQFKQAGWAVTSAVTTKDAGLAAFAKKTPNERWTAMLALYPINSTIQTTYDARLDASGTPNMSTPKPAPQQPLSVAAHIRKSDLPALAQLVSRMLDYDGTHDVGVYVHRAPPQLSASVPLPRGTLVASTISEPGLAIANGEQGIANLYYALTQAQLKAYERALSEDGWKEQGRMFGVSGGFVPTHADARNYCKRGMPALSLSAVPNSSDVTIGVSTSLVASDCPEFPQPTQTSQELLPKIYAPGTVVARWTTNGFGNAASFTSNLPPAPLLDSFMQQLKQSGWTPGARVASDSLGMQYFTRTVTDGRHLQAELSLYRYSGAASSYGAVVDVTVIPPNAASER